MNRSVVNRVVFRVQCVTWQWSQAKLHVSMGSTSMLVGRKGVLFSPRRLATRPADGVIDPFEGCPFLPGAIAARDLGNYY